MTGKIQVPSQEEIEKKKKQFIPHLKKNSKRLIITNKKKYKQQDNIDYIFQLCNENMNFKIGKGINQKTYTYIFETGECYLNKQQVEHELFFNWIKKMDQDTLENKVLAYEETH